MDDHQPLVSVILPFYNAPHLKEAIESILNQSYSHFELLLINNDSTDDSVKVAEQYASHTNVRILQEDKRGVVFAANTGIKKANGTFIARMDSDDVATLDRLETQVNYLLSNPSVQVVSGLVDYLGASENEGFIQYVDWLNSITSPKDIYLNQFVEFPLANPTLMFRKSVFGHGMYQDGDFPEDYEFFLRLQAEGITMAKVKETVLTWRDSETRLTRTDPKYTHDAFFKVKAKYLAQWLKKNNPFHPKVYLWGAGRLSRRRSDYLLEQGVEVIKYIDLKASDHVLHFELLPNPEEAFIVSYVANRGARAQIRSFLDQRGYVEGLNYIIAS